MKKLHYVVASLILCAVSHAGLITHTDYTPGSVITSAGQNANENTIVNEVNGNLNSANIAPLGVATSNLAAGVVTQPKLGGGAFSMPTVVTKSANYTLLSTDDIIFTATTIPIILTLPSAAANSGKAYLFKKADSTNTVVLITTGTTSDRIDSDVDVKMKLKGESWMLVSDGTVWRSTLHTYPSLANSYTPSTSGFGAPTNVSFQYTLNGNIMRVWGTFTAGTIEASAGGFTLPAGFRVDSSLMPAGMEAGNWYRFAGSSGIIYGGSTRSGVLFVDTNLGTLNVAHTATNGFNNDLMTALANNSDKFSFDITVPVVTGQ